MQKAKFKNYQAGQAVLTAVFALLVLSLAILGGFAGPVARQSRLASELWQSKTSFYAAESGIEDATYRIRRLLPYSLGYTLPVGGSTAAVTITEGASTRSVTALGDLGGAQRQLRTKLDLSTVNASFFYGLQVSDGGLYLNNNSRVEGNVYSNGDIFGGNGSVVTGDAVVAGGINPSPELEWSIQDSDFFFATASANRDVAQSFSTSVSGRLNRVTVYLGKVGAPTGNLTLRVAANNGAQPSTASLASAVIPPALVGQTPSWISISFASPPTLTAGSKYWLVLDANSDSPVNYWNWRRDSTDSYGGHTGLYTSNCCSGSPTWSSAGGDLAFQVWVGGVNTKIEGVTIGDSTSGAGRANLFVNATIHGSLCPNPYCLIDNPPREELPIPDGVIQDWRNDAAAGGVCGPPVCDAGGNFFLDNRAAASLGPLQIPGNLTIDNNAVLTLTGTIWVQGNILLSNGCVVRLDPGYGPLSGVVVTDGTVVISNNCAFEGSGSPQGDSYVLLLSAKDDPGGNVMTISNNSVGVIYYANRGRLHFSNNAVAKEATAYGITLDNNAIIQYESGLANIVFTSGPGASYDITNWQEI